MKCTVHESNMIFRGNLNGSRLDGRDRCLLGRLFNVMRNMVKCLLLTALSSVTTIADANPIECLENDEHSFVALMIVPHPREALIHRPSGETVWLQMEGSLAHEQISNFEMLERWVIDASTVGTVYNDGNATIEAVIKGRGTYHLYVAENTETEKENTYFIECYFDVSD